MEWRNIHGYEGLYQVSDTGEVRSVDRITTGSRTRKIKGVVLKKTKTTTGYLAVTLCKDGKPKIEKVHRLVAKAFIENPNGKPNINHIDNNPLNNNVSNLEWCTQSENLYHAYRIGAAKQSTKPKIATDSIVEAAIKEYIPYDREHSVLAISKKIGISAPTLYTAMKRCLERQNRALQG